MNKKLRQIQSQKARKKHRKNNRCFSSSFQQAFEAKLHTKCDQKTSQKRAKIKIWRERRIPRKRRWKRVGLRVATFQILPISMKKCIRKVVEIWIEVSMVLGIILNINWMQCWSENGFREVIQNTQNFVMDFWTIFKSAPDRLGCFWAKKCGYRASVSDLATLSRQREQYFFSRGRYLLRLPHVETPEN